MLAEGGRQSMEDDVALRLLGPVTLRALGRRRRVSQPPGTLARPGIRGRHRVGRRAQAGRPWRRGPRPLQPRHCLPRARPWSRGPGPPGAGRRPLPEAGRYDAPGPRRSCRRRGAQAAGASCGWPPRGEQALRLYTSSADAITCYRRTLRLLRQVTDRLEQAGVLARLGDAHTAVGNRGAARGAWHRCRVPRRRPAPRRVAPAVSHREPGRRSVSS
jgi:hypothetical protein